MEVAVSTKTIFLNGLRNGLGLSRSAINAGVQPKTMSNLITLKDEFRLECNTVLAVGYQNLLALSASYAKDKKYRSWEEKVEALRGFIIQLNTWECYCKKTDLKNSADKFMRAMLHYKVPEEVATVTGMTKMEMVDYIVDRPHLYLFLKDNKIDLV